MSRDDNRDAMIALVREVKRMVQTMCKKLCFDKTYVGTIVSINKDGYTIAAKNNSKIEIETTATDVFKKGEVVKFCEPQNMGNKRYFLVDLDLMKRYVDERIAEILK